MSTTTPPIPRSHSLVANLGSHNLPPTLQHHHRPLATAPHLLFRSLRRRLGSRPGRRRLCGRSMLRKVEVLPGRHLQLLQASVRAPPTQLLRHSRQRAKLSADSFLAHAEVEHDAAGANFSCRRNVKLLQRGGEDGGLARGGGLSRLWLIDLLVQPLPPFPCTLLPDPAADSSTHTCPHTCCNPQHNSSLD